MLRKQREDRRERSDEDGVRVDGVESTGYRCQGRDYSETTKAGKYGFWDAGGGVVYSVATFLLEEPSSKNSDPSGGGSCSRGAADLRETKTAGWWPSAEKCRRRAIRRGDGENCGGAAETEREGVGGGWAEKEGAEEEGAEEEGAEENRKSVGIPSGRRPGRLWRASDGQ
ncbi:hypothetical protein EX30DRAFT_347902 [Ascodesmis nigricans]|uniref:Uncharacterized protein n=1 Tax=Ascodesmis nigricans TaxID=341454 RepID=A0A4V3SJ52_9PEZI|nr:hypothetical protein EX30DRAFT_347902 [Ascodesmis nigricans]